MAVDPRAKGARAETVIKEALRQHTGLGWERVPGSGALDPKHKLKGDLYIPNSNNVFCVEAKHYADDHLTSAVLTSKNPQLLQFWEQTVREAGQVDKVPLLIFKHDRSKLFVSFEKPPEGLYNYVFICRDPHMFYVALLDDWLQNETIKFTT
jgi:hypothetical protein